MTQRTQRNRGHRGSVECRTSVVEASVPASPSAANEITRSVRSVPKPTRSVIFSNKAITLVRTMELIILLVLVFFAITVTYFMMAAACERRTAKRCVDGNRIRMYVEDVLDLVQEHIDTAMGKPPTNNTPVFRSWVSQGEGSNIRTFDQIDKPSQTYKLYSWDDIVAEREKLEFPITDPRLASCVNNGGGVADISTYGIELTNDMLCGRAKLPTSEKWIFIYVLEDGTFMDFEAAENAKNAITPTAENPIVACVALQRDSEEKKWIMLPVKFK